MVYNCINSVQNYWNEIFGKYNIRGDPPEAIEVAENKEFRKFHYDKNKHILTKYKSASFYTTLNIFYPDIDMVNNIERLDAKEIFGPDEIKDAQTFEEIMEKMK